MSYAGDVKLQIINSRLTSDEAVSGEKLAYAILHGNTVTSENKTYIERISKVYRYNDPDSFVRFFIEAIRIDSLMLYNIKISQILSLVLFVVFCIILSKKHTKKLKS